MFPRATSCGGVPRAARGEVFRAPRAAGCSALCAGRDVSALVGMAPDGDKRGMAYLTRGKILRPLAALIGLLAAAPAGARVPPPAPASGMVIHLFGPDSLASHLLPTAPQAPDASTAPRRRRLTHPRRRRPLLHPRRGRRLTSSTAPSASGQPAAAAASPAPGLGWGAIAHQMFVTGDPAQEGPAALSKGKAGGN